MTNDATAPKGAVPLAEAIAALRNELLRAWWDRDKFLRFKPAPIELTLQVAVTSTGKGSAGVSWWLIELGGELSRESVVTQELKITLEPKLFDSQGKEMELLIDAAYAEISPTGQAGEIPLDAAGH
jgi:hypothetical protein